MKVIKAIICALLCSFILAMPVGKARAAVDGRTYARADARTIYFCSDMNDASALFALPYTYCVEILADHGDWYLVKYARDEGIYAAVTGYCKKTDLTPVTEPGENIYLNYPVEAVLRSYSPSDGSIPPLEITVTAAYYGTYYKGAAAYSYVRYDNRFCYIEGTFEDYPLNDIPAEPTFSETTQNNENGNAQLITAIVISVIAAAVIVILVFAGKRRGIKPYNRQ